MRTRTTLALAASATAILGGLALAAPSAMAQSTPGPAIPISVNVAETLSMTTTTSAVNFGSLVPGANWSSSLTQQVAYTVSSNDGAGDIVTVYANGDLTGAKNAANKIPAADVGVWGAAQNNSAMSGLAGTVTFPDGILPAALPNAVASALTTSSAGGPVAGTSYTDNYAFLGGVKVMNGLQVVQYTGSPVPAGTPADTYASTLEYTLIGN